MTEQDRKELLDLPSATDADARRRADAARSSRPSQEQTERNARDIAKQAEALPDPAPAAKLTAAAGKMERAIVDLRASKLRRGLRARRRSRRSRPWSMPRTKIDEAWRKADKQLRQQDQETIKQAYVKILEEQKKLDKPRPSASTRPQGATTATCRATEAVRLGQLPGEQGKLSERTRSSARSSRSSSSHRLRLGQQGHRQLDERGEGRPRQAAKPATSTQAEQTRIDEQLQAMIDNLEEARSRAQVRPEAAAAAAAGSADGRSMPTEAELRLLKAPAEGGQQQHQDGRRRAARRTSRSCSRLGGRQGELRDLLDQMLQKASQGKVKLGAEPDNKDQLPEEANDEDIENQELDKQLLDDDTTATTTDQQGVKLDRRPHGPQPAAPGAEQRSRARSRRRSRSGS